jgi:hypothetical protein
MNEITNPQVDACLDALATICCDTVNRESDAGLERTDALLKSLLMSGYGRAGSRPLQVDLDARLKQKCAGGSPFKASEMSSMSGQLAMKFANLAQRESKTPVDETKP